MNNSDIIESNAIQPSFQDKSLEQIDDEASSSSAALTSESLIAEAETLGKKRTRTVRPYPSQSFEDSLELALAIQQHSSGRPIRRLTLFHTLGKSPESSASRQWVSSASGYGLIKGTAASEYLELTEEGKIASGEEFSEYERAGTRANLAILHIPTFKSFYDELAGSKFPSQQFLMDLAKKFTSESLAREALDLFIVNAKFVGLLRVMSGTERLLTIEHLLDLISTETPQNNLEDSSKLDEFDNEPSFAPTVHNHESPTTPTLQGITSIKSTLEEVCFYVCPIGEPNSEQRQHSDLFFNYIIQPALEGTGLKPVRNDKIDRGGIITSQIIRQLIKSRLVIADLSFSNANVFYELAIRHATRLPTVQIIRSVDSIPFDLNQIRTVRIDTTSIYTLIPQLNTYIAEISTQVKRALEGAEDSDNPISVFYPNFKVSID